MTSASDGQHERNAEYEGEGINVREDGYIYICPKCHAGWRRSMKKFKLQNVLTDNTGFFSCDRCGAEDLDVILQFKVHE